MAKAERPTLMSMGANTRAESNTSSETSSLLLLSYQQLVGQLNWNDRQNGVTATEAHPLNKPLSPVVFPMDRPATTVLPGSAGKLGHTATLATVIGMTVRLHKKDLLVGTLLQSVRLMHPSTEAHRTTAISMSVLLSSNNNNSLTTHTQSVTIGVLSTVWSMLDAAANTANWILGRNASMAKKWYCKTHRRSDGK